MGAIHKVTMNHTLIRRRSNCTKGAGSVDRSPPARGPIGSHGLGLLVPVAPESDDEGVRRMVPHGLGETPHHRDRGWVEHQSPDGGQPVGMLEVLEARVAGLHGVWQFTWGDD